MIWTGAADCCPPPWWRHQMETCSALLGLCVGNSQVTSESPSQRPVTRSFDVFFDLRPNKQLNKQSRGWWFETPPRSLWRHFICKRSWGRTYVLQRYAFLGFSACLDKPLIGLTWWVNSLWVSYGLIDLCLLSIECQAWCTSSSLI